MNQQGEGFGRRASPSQRGAPGGATPAGRMSLLAKQIGAMALGVALVFAAGASGVYFWKQAGKSVARNFIELAAPGNPAIAIEQVGGGDALLQRVHRICTDRSARVDLTDAQKRATDGHISLYSGELQLARAAAYVACLTTEQPQRFCQKPQRHHLIEAVRQYTKLAGQVHGEWQLQMSGPAATMVAAPLRSDQLAALGMPSAQLDPQVQEGLAALDTNGYVPAGDFTGIMGLNVSGGMPRALGGTPRGMPQPFGGNPPGTQSRKSACS